MADSSVLGPGLIDQTVVANGEVYLAEAVRHTHATLLLAGGVHPKVVQGRRFPLRGDARTATRDRTVTAIGPETKRAPLGTPFVCW
jgi:hypothetical protein